MSAWFAGGGVDYLLDAEEAYINGHLGYDFGCGHALFLEIGWIQQDDDFTAFGPNPNPPNSTFLPVNPLIPLVGSVDIDIVPVTINYKYEYSFTDRLAFYAGVGAGASYIDVEARLGAVRAGDSEWSFTAQAFTGLVYNVSDAFEIYGGVRYLWLDDPTVFGVSVGDLDDFGVGGGIRFNF